MMTEQERLALIDSCKARVEQIEKDIAIGWTADAFELKLARIALSALQDKPVVPEGWVRGKYAYQSIFNAIARSVSDISENRFTISVRAFEDSMMAISPDPGGDRG